MIASRTLAVCCASLALLASCRSIDMEKVREAFDAGRLAEARELLVEYEERREQDRHLIQMELAIVELAAGRPDAAVEVLRRAKTRLEDLVPYHPDSWADVGALVEGGLSFLSDERASTYEPRDYELQLVYALLTVAELMRRGGDATAYSLQGLERSLAVQGEIDEDTEALYRSFREFRGLRGENPKEAYRLVAFGDYVRAAMLEEHPTRQNAAERAYARAFELAPSFPYAEETLARVRGEVRPEPDEGAVVVFALVGRGPQLVERWLEAPAEEILLLLRMIWAAQAGHVALPIVTGIRVPALAFHQENPSQVLVYADGALRGTAGSVTDVERAAAAEFEAMEDTIVLRAVLRRAVKLTFGELAKRGLRSDSSERGYDLLDLGLDLGVALWTGVERADLRSWSLLPARIDVLRVPLREGSHRITLRTTQGLAPGQSVDVRVTRGRHTYVLAFVPSRAGGPEPLTTDPVAEPPSP